MSRTDDLRVAADRAREQVEEARRALGETLDVVGGGPARDPAQAQAQLARLRESIGSDVATLRARLDGATTDGASALRGGLAAGAAGLVGLVGAGLLVRSRLARGRERRADDRMATAIADALARRGGDGGGGRGPGGGLLAAALGTALAAGAAAVIARRRTPPTDDDLWA
jgi:hypothetical protein